MKHPKENAEATAQAFGNLVQGAVRQGRTSVFELRSGRKVRVKRALKAANQVHPLWGETLVIHIPGAIDQWYVVPPRWQLAHAVSSAAVPHHALVPLECMQLRHGDLEGAHLVADPTQLESRCDDAAYDAEVPDFRNVLAKATQALDAYRKEIGDAAGRLSLALKSLRAHLAQK